MARGKTSTLVPFNSKVDPSIKQTCDALVATKVNGCGSVHELLKDMLKVYEIANPQGFAKARKYLEVIGYNMDEREDGGV